MEALNCWPQVRLLNQQMPHTLKGGHDNDFAVQVKHLRTVSHIVTHIQQILGNFC